MEPTRERVEAMMRMLVDSGDATPMATRQILSLFSEAAGVSPPPAIPPLPDFNKQKLEELLSDLDNYGVDGEVNRCLRAWADALGAGQSLPTDADDALNDIRGALEAIRDGAIADPPRFADSILRGIDWQPPGAAPHDKDAP